MSKRTKWILRGVPFYGALHTPFDSGPYEAGWHQVGKTRMHVSRAVGPSIFSLRFNDRRSRSTAYATKPPRDS